MALADQVRRLRAERYLSQAELAKEAGVSRTTLARIEAGQIVPYPRTVRQLANALGVPPAELAPPEELVRKDVA